MVKAPIVHSLVETHTHTLTAITQSSSPAAAAAHFSLPGSSTSTATATSRVLWRLAWVCVCFVLVEIRFYQANTIEHVTFVGGGGRTLSHTFG